MKFTVATFAALAVAVAAKPAFTNTGFDVEQGEAFTLTYSGCDSGCTITLLNGDSKDLNDYKVLTSDATGDSFTFTLSGIPSDTYAFKITDNDSGEYNYSSQFKYVGTGVATTAESTTAVSTTAVSTTAASTSAASTTAESTTKSATKKATTLSKVTSTTSAEAVTTPASKNVTTTPHSTKASKTSASSSGTEATTGAESTATTVPDSGAARLSSSIALIAGAVMAMVYLN